MPAAFGLASRYPFYPSYIDNGGGNRVASLGWSPFDQPAYAACRNGTQLWVALNGNDTTGTGTFAAPFATLDKAQTVLNAGGVPGTIIGYVAATNEEHRRLFGGQITVKPTVDTAYLAKNGIWRAGIYDQLTWSQNTGTFAALTGNPNVWAAARSVFGSAWNPQMFDGMGYPIRYTPVGSVAAVNRIPGSVYSDGTNVYISTFDGANPSDSNVRVNLNLSAIAWTSFNTPVNVYFDGETAGDGWAFDGACQIAATALWGSLKTIALRRCSFSRNTGNSYSFEGINGLVWVENCSGISSGVDVYNFHNVMGADMTGVVLNSTAVGAGRTAGSQSNNCITGHENCKVISGGNRFEDSSGGNIRFIDASKLLSFADYISGDKGDIWQGGTMPATEVRTDGTATIWMFDPIIEPRRPSTFAMYATSASKILTRGVSALRGLIGGAGFFGKW
ncbi:hypothetical protein [Bradyrhizobium phage BDU-MI-1]|nr:hypothetical protein [Bradyrhizobium phage BDU-MI-1]